MFHAHSPNAFICTLSAEQDEQQEPTAFGLMRITPPMRVAIDAAYEQLSRGVPGDIEIPVVLPLLPARRESAVARSAVPHARVLQAALTMLNLYEDERSYAVGDKVCEAFEQVTTTRPANAVLIVSRLRPPRIRTGVRGGRTRFVSRPIQQLAPRDWAHRPERASLRLVTVEHHRS